MYQYTKGNLPRVFDILFLTTSSKHDDSTRLASKSTFFFPKIRTNYGKFDIRYSGSKVWKDIDESVKALSNRVSSVNLKHVSLTFTGHLDSTLCTSCLIYLFIYILCGFIVKMCVSIYIDTLSVLTPYNK